ncbi:hypothetical protein FCH83_01385 [Pseudomonas putida]|nr:hypothetical protein [Pseudomonas putida]NTY98967.1 hypothetical protein [Pseudomonas putida]NTZ21250.1 hypothetical protein [Pseudomonas putida]NTZ53231.1 hypothetical protein [Pseudomonas putida]NTZ65119.1 hypothetical protein [Pseudomonas putida]
MGKDIADPGFHTVSVVMGHSVDRQLSTHSCHCENAAIAHFSRPARTLLKQLSCSDSKSLRDHCGSGFTREESCAVDGTGFAGVRG